ncbi:hypothetical protein TNCV_4804461 [Trichonephila clavipes]|nr:hypothetical protein TNCV_4804461 [Trichonephila clavipes]
MVSCDRHPTTLAAESLQSSGRNEDETTLPTWTRNPLVSTNCGQPDDGGDGAKIQTFLSVVKHFIHALCVGCLLLEEERPSAKSFQSVVRCGLIYSFHKKAWDLDQ